MSTVFGEVAGLYDRARPDCLPELADVVLDYAGGPPADAAEVGAGTGKGTALFVGRGFPITCIEPDARMSKVLVARFPELTVMTSAFEEWKPPDGGVGLLFAATAWHWVDPDRRASLAARALAPGGTLALIGRRTQHRNPQLDAQIEEAFRRFGPHAGNRSPVRRIDAYGGAVDLCSVTVTRMIRAGVGPFRNNVAGGVHIHHAVPGIVLILDEFALILHLQ